MKPDRTVWILWISLFALVFLAAIGSIGLFTVAVGMPFETAQQFVNGLSADQKVENFNPQVLAQLRWGSLLFGVIFSLIFISGVIFRKKTLCWVEIIVIGIRTIAIQDQTQLQTTRKEKRGSWLSSLLLVLSFWAVYALIGLYLRSTYLFTRINMIFDADFPLIVPAIAAWGGESGKHPLFTLFFSPIGMIFAGLTKSPDLAAVLMSALFGALCVLIVRETLLAIGLTPQASLLWVLVLGISTTHLVFASLPETYIFAAAGIALIIYLMVRYPGNTLLHIPAGIYTLGVTVTNIVVATIAYILSLRNTEHTDREKLARVGLYFSIIIVVAAILNIGSVVLLRRGALFFIPGVYTSDISYTSWRDPTLLKGRTVLILENTFLYNVVSARPYLTSLKTHYDLYQPNILTSKDLESFDNNNRQSFVTFIPSSILKIPLAGLLAALLWISFLSLTVYFLIFNKLCRTPLIQALLLCLLFNFGFHLLFGLDVFLYSSHWTMLIVLLSAACLVGRLPERVLRGGLVLLFLSLLLNNSLFIISLRQIFQI